MLGELRQVILAADVVAAQLERSHTENVARLEAETLRLQLEASQLRSQLEEKDVALQSTIMDLESCRGMREELRRSCVASRKEGMHRSRGSASLSVSSRMQLAFVAWRKRRHTSGPAAASATATLQTAQAADGRIRHSVRRPQGSRR